MTKYLISFPGSAMDISDEEMAAVGDAAHAVIREAKGAGVYVFGGGINGAVARSRRPMGREDRQSVPLLAGTPRVRVRPRELTREVTV